MSLAKQNFASQSEEALNQQVNTELQASQVYLSMAAWAQHSSVALPGKDYYTLHRKKFLWLIWHSILKIGLEKYFRESANEVSNIYFVVVFMDTNLYH